MAGGGEEKYRTRFWSNQEKIQIHTTSVTNALCRRHILYSQTMHLPA